MLSLAFVKKERREPCVLPLRHAKMAVFIARMRTAYTHAKATECCLRKYDTENEEHLAGGCQTAAQKKIFPAQEKKFPAREIDDCCAAFYPFLILSATPSAAALFGVKAAQERVDSAHTNRRSNTELR